MCLVSFVESANRAGRIIFELIKGEMDYVKDLENIEVVCHVVLIH